VLVRQREVVRERRSVCEREGKTESGTSAVGREREPKEEVDVCEHVRVRECKSVSVNGHLYRCEPSKKLLTGRQNSGKIGCDLTKARIGILFT